MKFTMERASDVKLIIWDLDDTFWVGTLSDNESVRPVRMNIELVKKLTDRGIMNAICSKNDRNLASRKLEEMGVSDFFVFNSINWEPKGMRVGDIIASMALRPVNVLFLDDNPSNLAEAERVCPDLMVSSPETIPALYAAADNLGKDDSAHSRLKQYKTLEKKRGEMEVFASNVDFLRQSGITVQFKRPDEESIPRVVELIQRSNQLNFTKKRIQESDLRRLMADENYELQCVSAADNYGQYGIVGFYALDKERHRLEHFLFSCRTMGMGLEQYVYASLRYPELTIAYPVSGEVSKELGAPDYIARVDRLPEPEGGDTRTEKRFSVLMKGPCDLEVMASYLERGDIVLEREFNFVDSIGNQADYCNHFVNVLNRDALSAQEWCGRYSFLSMEGFTTRAFSGKYDVICLSPLMDATLAVYEDRLGRRLAYGLYSKPLSDAKNHDLYLRKQIMTARSSFQAAELKAFSEEFHQVDYAPADIAANLERLIHLILESNQATKFVIFLLPELPYQSKDTSYADFFANKHLIHRNINEQIKARLQGNRAVYLLDVNRYVKSQSDYFDNINHYSKYVYYKLAQEFADYLHTTGDVEVKTSSVWKALYQNFRRMVYKRLFVK